MPKTRRLLFHRLKGEHHDLHRCRGIVYQMGFQLEIAEPDIFWGFQQELLRDGQRSGLLHTFDGGGRLALGAISYIQLETRDRSLLIQAFHTFPADLAIVKTQSLFELVLKNQPRDGVEVAWGWRRWQIGPGQAPTALQARLTK